MKITVKFKSNILYIPPLHTLTEINPNRFRSYWLSLNDDRLVQRIIFNNIFTIIDPIQISPYVWMPWRLPFCFHGTVFFDNDCTLFYDNDCTLLYDNDWPLLYDNDCTILYDNDCTILHDNDYTLLYDNDCILLYDKNCTLLYDDDSTLLYYKRHISDAFLMNLVFALERK